MRNAFILRISRNISHASAPTRWLMVLALVVGPSAAAAQDALPGDDPAAWLVEAGEQSRRVTGTGEDLTAALQTKGRLLATVAALQAELGEAEAAEKNERVVALCIRALSHDGEAGWVHAARAWAAAEVGDAEEAQRRLEAIDRPAERAYVEAVLSDSLGPGSADREGLSPGFARQLDRVAAHRWIRDQAAVAASTQSIDVARARVEMLSDPAERAWAAVGVAEGLQRRQPDTPAAPTPVTPMDDPPAAPSATPAPAEGSPAAKITPEAVVVPEPTPGPAEIPDIREAAAEAEPPAPAPAPTPADVEAAPNVKVTPEIEPGTDEVTPPGAPADPAANHVTETTEVPAPASSPAPAESVDEVLEIPAETPADTPAETPAAEVAAAPEVEPKAPEAPETVEVPRVPELIEPSEVQQAVETPTVVETTETPAVTPTPESPETPQTQEVPENPATPAASRNATSPDPSAAEDASAAASTPPPTAAPRAVVPNLKTLTDPAAVLTDAPAPEQVDVRFVTTAGAFTIRVHRDWAPLAADRFVDLARAGYYHNQRFFRVVPGFVVQWGIHGYPAVAAAWRDRTLPDEPHLQPNRRGTVALAAAAVPDSRTTQVFINLVDNGFLDELGFVPFGEVVDGLPVVESLFGGHGETPSQQQRKIQLQGNAFLDAEYPELDSIISVEVR